MQKNLSELFYFRILFTVFYLLMIVFTFYICFIGNKIILTNKILSCGIKKYTNKGTITIHGPSEEVAKIHAKIGAHSALDFIQLEPGQTKDDLDIPTKDGLKQLVSYLINFYFRFSSLLHRNRIRKFVFVPDVLVQSSNTFKIG